MAGDAGREGRCEVNQWRACAIAQENYNPTRLGRPRHESRSQGFEPQTAEYLPNRQLVERSIHHAFSAQGREQMFLGKDVGVEVGDALLAFLCHAKVAESITN